jgi:cell division protein FtsZ
MSINLKIPDIRELKPRITVFGVGGAGGNAVNNMINAGLQGVDFVVGNTDAQALTRWASRRPKDWARARSPTSALPPPRR